jgi:hypothetical protein
VGDQSGVTYIGCRYDELTPRVFVKWDEVLVTDTPTIAFAEGPEVVVRQPVTFIIPRVYVAVSTDKNHANSVKAQFDWNELGLVQLKPVDTERSVESVYAIRGTDWTNLSTIMTSVGDVLGESCAFESAAIIIKLLGERVSSGTNPSHPKTYIIVTGHSLGGSVTQYVGQSNVGPHGYIMHGYAFNAMGVDESEATTNGPQASNLLYSHYIHGDPVSRGGKLLGRIQPGTVLLSKPATSLRKWLEFLDDTFFNPIYRHKLITVQGTLCLCLNKQGRIEEK